MGLHLIVHLDTITMELWDCITIQTLITIGILIRETISTTIPYLGNMYSINLLMVVIFLCLVIRHCQHHQNLLSLPLPISQITCKRNLFPPQITITIQIQIPIRIPIPIPIPPLLLLRYPSLLAVQFQTKLQALFILRLLVSTASSHIVLLLCIVLYSYLLFILLFYLWAFFAVISTDE